MLIESARRAHAAAKETLALVNEGSASCAEMREMLAEFQGRGGGPVGGADLGRGQHRRA